MKPVKMVNVGTGGTGTEPVLYLKRCKHMAERAKILRGLDHDGGAASAVEVQDNLGVREPVELGQRLDEHNGQRLGIEEGRVPLRDDCPKEIILSR